MSKAMSIPTTPSLLTRRHCLQGGASLLLTLPLFASGTSLLAVRAWPAAAYTRLTFESDAKLNVQYQVLSSPLRLQVDFEDLQLGTEGSSWTQQVLPTDPFVEKLRVEQPKPKILRLTIVLKQTCTPQVFALNPVGPYQHRLVFDLYPTVVSDPLELLIQSKLGEKPSSIHSGAASSPKASESSDSDPITELLQRQAQAAKSTASSPSQAAASATNSASKPSATLHKKRYLVLAVDPGHGGEDPGAIGPGGSYEKDVVLQIAKLLFDRLQTQSVQRKTSGRHSGSFEIVPYLTRDADYFVPLHQRVQKARAVKAQLLLSVHADAFLKPHARGASVFVLSEKGASSTAAKWIADKENKADLIGGINIKNNDKQVQKALLDMSTTAQIKDSLFLGKAMLGELGQVATLHKGEVEQAGFAVLKAPDMPSVLIETAFISNPEEERKLRSPSHQAALVDAMSKGIFRYLQTASLQNTL
jgi:N-acetylmuramoyl-L-alanine amidase